MRLRFDRVAAAGGALLVVAFAAAYFVFRPMQASGPPMGDFSAYYAAGAVWLRGGDPYGSGVWAIERTLPGANPGAYAMLPYVGPPLGLPLWAMLALLPYGVATVVWGAVQALCAGVIFAVPIRLVRRKLEAGDVIALLLLAAVSGPLVDGVSLGQAALPATAAIALAILAAAGERWIAVGAWAAVAAVFKPNLALALAGMLVKPAAALALVVAAVVSGAANVAAAGGAHGALAYLRLLPSMTGAERYYAYQFTPTAIAFGLGANRHVAMLIGDAVVVLVVAATVVAIARARASLADAAAIACAALPFVIPYVHEPDFAIAYIPALLAIFRARGMTWVVAAVGTILLAIDAFALALGRAGIAFSLVSAAVAGAELAALAHDVPRPLRLAPLAVCAFVAAIGAAAPAARLPMWPADLPAHFAATAGAPANEQWREELVATGLEQKRPWPAVLRMMTLCGSGLVGVALLRTARVAR